MAIGDRTFHARKREDIFVGRDAKQDLFRVQCQKLLTAGGEKKFVIFLDSCEVLIGGKKLAVNNLRRD